MCNLKVKQICVGLLARCLLERFARLFYHYKRYMHLDATEEEEKVCFCSAWSEPKPLEMHRISTFTLYSRSSAASNASSQRAPCSVHCACAWSGLLYTFFVVYLFIFSCFTTIWCNAWTSCNTFDNSQTRNGGEEWRETNWHSAALLLSFSLPLSECTHTLAVRGSTVWNAIQPAMLSTVQTHAHTHTLDTACRRRLFIFWLKYLICSVWFVWFVRFGCVPLRLECHFLCACDAVSASFVCIFIIFLVNKMV